MGLHPYDGETKAEVHRPADAVDVPPGRRQVHLDEVAAVRRDCRWRSGRWPGMLVAYASGHEDVQGDGDGGARPAGRRPGGPVLDPGPDGGARHRDGAARAPDEGLVRPPGWPDQGRRHRRPSTATRGIPTTWPATAQGYGYLDAPRGALGHWVQIEDGKISRYQCVVPSTWNCSPRDAQGQIGPYEAALMDNHPLVDPEQPIEILRTIHSFDPCMACGVHVLDATGEARDGGEGPMTNARQRPWPGGEAPWPLRQDKVRPSLGVPLALAAPGDALDLRRAASPSWSSPASTSAGRTSDQLGRRAATIPDGLDPLHPLHGGRRSSSLPPSSGSTGCSSGTSSSGGSALFPCADHAAGRTCARCSKKYLLIEPERAPHYLGHNPLQQVTYSLLYLIAIVQVVTGFAMYGLSNPGGFFYTLFAWVGPLFGGTQIVRLRSTTC